MNATQFSFIADMNVIQMNVRFGLKGKYNIYTIYESIPKEKRAGINTKLRPGGGGAHL